MNRPIYQFQVKGSGYFPVDMLRYDTCWPSTSDDAANLTINHRDDLMLVRQIELNGIRIPTVDRWLSFGWKVLLTPVWKKGKMTEEHYKVIA